MNEIAIIISTYYRPDGKTKYFMERNLNSLKNQTNQNFKVFLIGDKYEKEDEFLSFSNIIDDIYIENLDCAKEREKYSGKILWCNGGVNAVNIGIRKALSEGFNWIINMDHDDCFLPTHLEDINSMFSENCIFVCSCCNYKNSFILPNSQRGAYIPMGERLVKSSACVDFSKIDITFRDVFEEEGLIFPSDADFWNRLNKIITELRYESYCTGNITCIHDEEGYTYNNL